MSFFIRSVLLLVALITHVHAVEKRQAALDYFNPLIGKMVVAEMSGGVIPAPTTIYGRFKYVLGGSAVEFVTWDDVGTCISMSYYSFDHTKKKIVFHAIFQESHYTTGYLDVDGDTYTGHETNFSEGGVLNLKAYFTISRDGFEVKSKYHVDGSWVEGHSGVAVVENGDFSFLKSCDHTPIRRS